jgi:hypothetical protein
MSASDLRSRGDRELARKILDDPMVQRVIRDLERAQEKTPRGIRRRLLATALRVTETMMPDIHAEVRACRESLGIEIPLEIYLYPGPEFNAACVKPEEGRLFILVSSGLMEAFPSGQRRFVLGHELGHHLFHHHDVPIGYVLRGNEPPRPELALRLFAWSRYAEVSADRAGAHCAASGDDVARALFRLASGLTRPLENLRIAEFADQADELQIVHEEPGRKAATTDWFSTHPFSPLRLKAVRLFFESELAAPGGFPVSTLEARVQELMAVMEPSYLDERSEAAETARRILFAGMIAIADASEGISDPERKVFEEFMGEGAFSDTLDIAAIKASLDERLAEGNRHVSHPRRIQVVRDLCVMARASGSVSGEEGAVIDHIAATLDVPRELVDETLAQDHDLD